MIILCNNDLSSALKLPYGVHIYCTNGIKFYEYQTRKVSVLLKRKKELDCFMLLKRHARDMETVAIIETSLGYLVCPSDSDTVRAEKFQYRPNGESFMINISLYFNLEKLPWIRMVTPEGLIRPSFGRSEIINDPCLN